MTIGHFNRNGEAFDKGETFSGVPYDVALEVVEDIRKLVPDDVTMAQFALRWILMNEAVSTVIPGAKNAEQANANALGSSIAELSPSTMETIKTIYENRIAPHVHQLW